LLEKSLFFLQNTTSYSNTAQRRNYSIRAVATSPNSFRSKCIYEASPVQSDCRITIPNLSATAMPNVSCITRWAGTGWFIYKALDEPYKAHFAHTLISKKPLMGHIGMEIFNRCVLTKPLNLYNTC